MRAQQGQTQHYAIRVSGRLDDRWLSWFDGMSLTSDGDGTTVLDGTLPDQAALYGILQKLRDAAIPLISINPSDTTRSSS